MNIELTKIETEVLGNLLDTELCANGISTERFNILARIKEKVFNKPVKDFYDEDDYFFPERTNHLSHNDRWGK